MKLRLLIAASIVIGLATGNTQAQSAMAGASDAGQFAMQAGIIGGTAQACGQNLSVYNAHVLDAINTLGKTSTERTTAMSAYQKALGQAQMNQSRHHTMDCSQVITSFNSLPLMRSDYKQTVLPGLAQLQTNPNMAGTTLPNNNSTTMPTNNLTPPATNTLPPVNTNPPQPTNNDPPAPNPAAAPAENKVAVIPGGNG